jgi:ABC-type Na+ transport system ATPase subunit NatA
MEEAERLCDRVAVLHDGHLRAVGTIPALLDRTQTGTLAEAFRSLVRG